MEGSVAEDLSDQARVGREIRRHRPFADERWQVEPVREEDIGVHVEQGGLQQHTRYGQLDEMLERPVSKSAQTASQTCYRTSPSRVYGP